MRSRVDPVSRTLSDNRTEANNHVRGRSRLLFEAEVEPAASNVGRVLARAQTAAPPVERQTSRVQRSAVQRRPEGANQTGLPDNLKAGIEHMSGFDLSDVRVKYNSDKPQKVQAHAYTQGTNIEIAPGQDRHVAHEAWHVVQQMQGRVQPTLHAHGVAINDNESLEREADVMGGKANA